MIVLSDVVKKYPTKSLDYGYVSVLNKVNLAIQSGQFVQIVGPSGSGKSTLLYILGLLTSINSGQYLLNGCDTAKMSAKEKQEMRLKEFGFIFQDYWLFERFTVRQNVEYPMKHAGVNKVERQQRVEALIEKVGLSERIDFYPGSLSGGELRRVAIARALANGPSVIFADEPTGNLDKAMTYQIMDLLKSLNQEGVTIIMVTHDENLHQYADVVYRIDDGVLVKKARMKPVERGL